jgi:hypothetical protein
VARPAALVRLAWPPEDFRPFGRRRPVAIAAWMSRQMLALASECDAAGDAHKRLTPPVKRLGAPFSVTWPLAWGQQAAASTRLWLTACSTVLFMQKECISVPVSDDRKDASQSSILSKHCGTSQAWPVSTLSSHSFPFWLSSLFMLKADDMDGLYITGGQNQTYGEWPSFAMVYIDGFGCCGGVLVSDRHVLASVSCLGNASPSEAYRSDGWVQAWWW